MLYLKFKEEIKNYINKGDEVVVAFSGGADSLFLLEMFLKMKDEYSLNIKIAYLNHNLRSDSKEEEKFVETIAKEKNLILYKKSLTISDIAKENKRGIEMVAREERYKFFEEISNETSKIALAHHIDDNIETFLFRLIRGSSLKGLKSIPFIRTKFIRPLLRSFYKEEILEYLEKNKIEYFSDYTNNSNIYMRNKIRNELIPILKQYNPNIKENIKNLIEESNSLPENYFNFEEQLNTNNLINLPLYRQKRILADFLSKHVEPSREKINNVLKILEKNGTTLLNIGNNKFLRKSYNILTIQEKKEISYNEISLPLNEEVKFNDYIIKVEIANRILADKAFYIDFEKIKLEELKIRNRLSGDIFRPLGCRYNKKLKEYFIDQKISKDLRDSIPLIAFGKKIVLIIGEKVSEEFLAKKNSKSILKIAIKEI